MVTFVIHPNWYAARTESKWDTNDIRCITANKDLEIKPETKQSSFSPTDVGGGLNASKNEQAFLDFSHELVTTIQKATVETVQAITAKNTRNNIDYDASTWRTAVNIPDEVEARRALH